MSELDDLLTMRFDETGRELLVFELDAEWDGEFPPSLMVTWQGMTFVMVVNAENGLLQIEAWPYVEGDCQGATTLTIQPLPK